MTQKDRTSFMHDPLQCSWYYFLFSIFFKVPLVSPYLFKFLWCCGFGIGFNFNQRSFGLTYLEVAAPNFFFLQDQNK